MMVNRRLQGRDAHRRFVGAICVVGEDGVGVVDAPATLSGDFSERGVGLMGRRARDLEHGGVVDGIAVDLIGMGMPARSRASLCLVVGTSRGVRRRR